MDLHGSRRAPVARPTTWLDATDSSDKLATEMGFATDTSRIPIPPVPTDDLLALHRPHHQKRRSAAAAVAAATASVTPASKPKRKTPRTLATPEVISNLIDSFSHLTGEPVPPSQTPEANRRRSQSIAPVLRHRASFHAVPITEFHRLSTSEPYSQGQLADDLLDSEAAEPPIVPTSKRWSARSASKASKAPHDATSFTPGSKSPVRLSQSLRFSYRGEDDAQSIGQCSNASSKRRRSLVSLGRESLNGNKARSQFTSLPTDEFGGSDSGSVRELVLNATGPPDHFTPPTTPRLRLPLESVIHEETLPAIAPHVSLTYPKPSRKGKEPVLSDSAFSFHVPNRSSSLRLSSRNRHSRDFQDRMSYADQPLEIERPQSQRTLEAVDGEPVEVTRRINDLKAKKELRDREARHLPTPEPDDASSMSVPEVGLTAAISSQKEARLAEKKARVANLCAIGTSIVARPSLVDMRTSSEPNALPPPPATPLTPTMLPINYSYIISKLDKKESSPPSAGEAPSERQSRRRSIGMSRRSVFSRPKAPAKITEADYHRPSTGSRKAETPEPVHDIPNEQRARLRKTSRPNLLRPDMRRWSQPDLLDGAKRSSGVQGAEPVGAQLTQRSGNRTGQKSSIRDSIDADVQKFTTHPRLTQRIRHPETGRTIAFSEVGDPNGHVVFLCVGMGLTRYVTAFYDELASTLGLRLITPDRPGVGESTADPNVQPLQWPDDVQVICDTLQIAKFSLAAHSAGAIYALATALRMPQHVRGKVHLLAPWIPPSQMAPIGLAKLDPAPVAQLPKSQRFLRAMPVQFLRIANTGLLGAGSASLNPNSATKRDRRRKSERPKRELDTENSTSTSRSNSAADERSQPHHDNILLMDQHDMLTTSTLGYTSTSPLSNPQQAHRNPERDALYTAALTSQIWVLATTAANPAVDLVICLERHRPIGFMYKDISRPLVIHHGSKDSRVPVENVRWLGSVMRRCEVRVLEGEGHGLMANAKVMGGVLEELAKEWADWEDAVGRGISGGRMG